MKKIYTSVSLLLLLLLQPQLYAQQINSHQSQPPPVNPGFPFTRGMYIDCAVDIVDDISNNNVLGLKQELLTYITNNSMTYIILCGLEHASIFGNAVKESALKNLITTLKRTIPGLRIGISGSDADSFTPTPALNFLPFTGPVCFPVGTLNNLHDLNDALNNPGLNSVNLKRSELCKFFLRASRFCTDSELIKSSINCKGAFDALYLEYRYWNQTSSLLAMQDEFTNYKTLLSVMQVIKCKNGCIRKIDAEFLPTDLFKLQAWTAIDQITEADPLADRLMIPSLTSNASGVFDNICKTLHFLSDRFSKPHSEILIEVSAESSSFNYCNSPAIPPDFLGNYLNGTVVPSGNMYSVEKMFLDKYNDPGYMCMLCSCFSYGDNHYSPANVYGNIFSGMMWTPYSMLNDHSLYKITNSDLNRLQDDKPVVNQVIDCNGIIVKNYQPDQPMFSDESLPDGIYFRRTIFSSGNIQVKKIFIHH